ncbi:flagellin [Mangrovibacter phragmitis]|uniref:Flagellin n=1 Tax=Mangrovibacter phragmitis TaxID=1691903 RepID=A0A1B7L3E6_9ENTR|nr:flagellin [Mangrovibacter phragmitis]OAT76934.1 flagellin [Mangrovibacter phragmitis]
MSMSIFTNASSMAAVNAMNKSNNMLSTAMERLGTGKRINSAADDAAGLQIATRLQGQVSGMAVAQRNISDATALLQTGEGAFDEMTNIMYRMKDLATQASNDTNSSADRTAIQAELNQLGMEMGNIMSNTSYAGDKLFAEGGKFDSELNFQIGASSGEVMKLDISDQLEGLRGALENLIPEDADTPAVDVSSAASAQALMDTLESAIDDVSAMRSTFGANINRLGHSAANLANMKDNTELGLGNIRDADFAAEATNMTRNQMLAQTSMSMLRQSNSMSGMVMSLLG